MQDIEVELNRTIRMLMAHPENEPNSEFSDRIDSLLSLREQLKKETDNQKEVLIATLNGWQDYKNQNVSIEAYVDEILSNI